MNEQKLPKEGENLPGVPLLLDSTGKPIRVLTREERERASKDWDEEFMCDKRIASFFRKWGAQHEKRQNA